MEKYVRLFFFILILFINTFTSYSQITLTHNIGDELTTPFLLFPSTNQVEHWARTFTLSEFGINNTEDFQINSGSIGIRQNMGSNNTIMQFNIYSIDNNFPASFSQTNLIGSSQTAFIPYIWDDTNPEIVTLTFDEPVVVPAGVNRILVEVKKTINPNTMATPYVFVAGTEEDNDISWYKTYGEIEYVDTANFTLPRPNANFYIVVNGEIVGNTFNFQHSCLGSETSFSLNFGTPIESIQWDFGDGTSSSEENPSHSYSNPGTYTVTATVLPIGSQVPQVISKPIEIHSMPNPVILPDIYACEDTPGSGLSSFFDTSDIENEILNGQTNISLSYFNENGDELPSPLPNLISNSIPYEETITVRLMNSNSTECYVETDFKLIVNELPLPNTIADLIACDDNNDGYASFNTSNIEETILANQPQIIVEYLRENGAIIGESLPDELINQVFQQETITARVINPETGCFTAVHFDLIAKNTPNANQPNVLIGCDDNNDGISEYFNTSTIESEVLQGQSGMEISYLDENGALLPTPLPNPYTNTHAFHENITVRVTDEETGCYDETILSLQTSIQPEIHQSYDLYSCDTGEGYATFNTTDLKEQLIGNQPNLEIFFFDTNNNPLSSPLPENFQNTEPYLQTLYVKVENSDNSDCYSETSVNLIVNELPQVQLEPQYFICDLNSFINLSVDDRYDNYEWYDEQAKLIANTYQAEISEEGNYTLVVSDLQNGITCENSFSFEIIRSQLPQIIYVNHGELGNNFIEIVASGDGNFEYSIDGENYQDSNYFKDILGGKYTVYVRDKEGCGADNQTVSVIDYPRFFTPNNDGFNDYWKIKGLDSFSQATISIFNRFGKLLVQLPSHTNGWDGSYNGRKMPSNEYWFLLTNLKGKKFSGHFTLKR